MIEDEQDDVFLFRRCLAQLNFKGTLHIVASVSEARQYLLGAGKFSDSEYYPCPELIVSDMALPGEKGTQLLQWMQSDLKCAPIPIFFFSGATVPVEKARALELGVREDQFFSKTGDIEKMRIRVAQMLSFLAPQT